MTLVMTHFTGALACQILMSHATKMSPMEMTGAGKTIWFQ